MELTMARCEQILNTLPIGYYTGRRIGVSLDEKEQTSFYSPMEDKIVVSYPIIAHRMKQLPEGTDSEEAVRSMLYHEVSHAILTPTCLQADNAVNIFEDERIESVLRNYYHNVDFRKQIYDLHGGHAPKPKNTEQAFYNAVRFGLGTGAVQKETRRLLNAYAKMNRTTPYYDSNPCASNYRWEVHKLYDLVQREFAKDPEAFEDKTGQGEQVQMDSLKQNGQESSKTSQKPSNQNENKEGEGEGEGEGNELELLQDRPDNVSDPSLSIEMSAEEMKRMVGACLGQKSELNESEQMKLNEFQKTVETIIGNFNKKNSGGSGINAYSGVFNPRAVVRKDYRFFERSMSTQGNNKFGTCHLNLIIDCSGSYCENVNLTNAILAVLTEIERKNRNFSMDVAFINHELHICKTVRDRRMEAWGGNSIPETMKQTLLELQKPQTCNYNIILFDGDAMCNNRELRSMSDYRKRFGVFDMKQTTLISDPDNKDYMEGFTSTKVVITKNYTEELVKHITHALTIAFG